MNMIISRRELFGLTAGGVLLRAQDGGQRPVFRVKVDMVVLAFTVTDNKNHYINGLKPTDVRIYEDGILQKLVAAGITTVEALADMTPEQLEEIPGIGEKTLEKISVAVRHYFGHFEEGEEGHVPEATEAGEAEVETAPAVAGDEEAEAENAAEVIEEAESTAAVGADEVPVSDIESAIENVPEAGDSPKEMATESATEEQSVKEDGA